MKHLRFPTWPEITGLLTVLVMALGWWTDHKVKMAEIERLKYVNEVKREFIENNLELE